MPKLLTVAEVAEYLRLSPSAIYVQRHRGENPGALAIAVSRRRLLFRAEDIERWLDQQQAAQAPL